MQRKPLEPGLYANKNGTEVVVAFEIDEDHDSLYCSRQIPWEEYYGRMSIKVFRRKFPHRVTGVTWDTSPKNKSATPNYREC